MLPTTLKPAPVTVAEEIVTVAVPVLLRVKVWGVVDPATTFPKVKLAALAASVPVFELEFDLDPGFAAPVRPTQPARGRSARHARARARKPSGARRAKVTWERSWEFVCAFMARPE
jgi:hypothetical protein